ncbi:helix-turn-helix transcriptional regulator [Maribellus sediminis]|uniref:helix-turn-helix transcriptional regulator n=1 Tax=Maribellus sediminis TaxID=2696285 RepID=UPI00142FE8DC|nr:helix-turn-helix domain-containing protein [Maribellus sediminis]
MEIKLKLDDKVIKEMKKIITKTIEDALKKSLPQIETLNKGQGTKDELMTRKQVMDLLNISHATLYHYQKSGKIPFKKIGNRVYFKYDDIVNNPELDGDPYDYKSKDQNDYEW